MDVTSTCHETLHYKASPDGPRFVVVTHPSGPTTGTGVVLCSGGWFSGSWYFNRLYVKLARSLAAQGHLVVRFDWYGSGESPGFLPRFRLSEPFADDVVGVATMLDTCERIVGVGYCFGAASLLAAADAIDNLAGVVLVSAVIPGSGPRARTPRVTPYTALRSAFRPSVIRGWLDPNTRRLYLKWLRALFRTASRRLQRQPPNRPHRDTMAMRLSGLAGNGVLVTMVYGEGDSNLSAFATEPLASVSRSTDFHVEILPGDVEGSGTLQIQDHVSRVISEAVEMVTRRAH